MLVCTMGGTIDGRNGDHLLIAPPYIVSAEEIDELVERLAAAVGVVFGKSNLFTLTPYLLIFEMTYEKSIIERMTMLTLPATRLTQGEITLYAASVKVKDLISGEFYSIEALDPVDPNDTGYQRVLNEARAKKLAAYITEGQKEKDVLIPTSLFLATEKNIPYDEEDKTVKITSAELPLNVVDGQHRIAGLVMAANKDARVKEFEVPINIAVNMSKTVQMCHFLLVNTTQKIVDKSVAQQIITRLTQIQLSEDVPSLPRWIQSRVDSGDDARAQRFVEYLNSTPGTPWYGKIKLANQKGSAYLINQRSFVDAIIKYVLTADNPLARVDMEQARQVFFNYWAALAQTIDINGEATVLYKYNGVNLFCLFSTQLFMKILNDGKTLTTNIIKEYLKSCFDNLDDYDTLGTPEYWTPGGPASNQNISSLHQTCTAMNKALTGNKNFGNVL